MKQYRYAGLFIIVATWRREVDGLIDALGCYGLAEGLILTDSEEDILEQDGYRITVKPVWK